MNSGALEKGWAAVWGAALGLSESAPQWIIAALGLFFIYFVVIFPSAAVLSFVDRKLGADFQARVGPNRAGPGGIFQPFSDYIKLLQKESSSHWEVTESVWVGVHTMVLFSTVAVLPLGSLILLVDTDMSAFIPFWAALVLALGSMLIGFSQHSIPGWLGGVRVASQALSGAFPALVALICAGFRSGGFRWSVLAGSQGPGPLSWAALSNPFQFLALLIFMISGLILLGVPPMDAPVSGIDIHGGVGAHLSGRRLILYRLGRFYGFFLWSVIAAVLFLGAWNLPESLFDYLRNTESLALLQLAELLVLLSKAYFLMLMVVWVARVNPRSRVDQITDFAWQTLGPFSLLALLGTGILAGWRAL